MLYIIASSASFSGRGVSVAKFFKVAEFKCPCGKCGGKPDPVLLEKLDILREKLGHPIRVTSGVRCQQYQDKLAAEGHPTAKRSAHVPGIYGPHSMAADLSCHAAYFEKMVLLAHEIFKCVGEGPGWIHVDLRADKERCWKY